jgi:predicted AAA+ superfamily ATPase
MVLYIGNNVYTQRQIDNAPRRAFERGHVQVVTKDHKAPFIPRNKEISNLVKFITESAFVGNYVVLLGEHGCGKTTLIEQTIQSDTLKQRGCVYISFPEPDRGKVKVTETLAAPFTYKRQRGFLAALFRAVMAIHKTILL